MEEAIFILLRGFMGLGFMTGASALWQSPAQYNLEAWNFARLINYTAVRPVAAVILAIMLMVELMRISARADGNARVGLELVGMTGLKMAVLVAVITHVDDIIDALNGIGTEILFQVSQTSNTGAGTDIPESLKDVVSSMGTIPQAIFLVLMIIPNLVLIAASVVVRVVVFMRFLELYILTCAASLPLAFLGHPDTKGIAIGYLKRYGAVVMHGVVIVLAIAIYTKIQMVDAGLAEIKTQADLWLTFINPVNVATHMVAPIVFIILVTKTGSIAKAFVGE